MSSIRSYLFAAAACASLVPFTACGGGSGDDKPDAPATPEGTHYGYVVSKAYVPSTDAEAMMWGLDIASSKSDKPDGTVDNKLGELFTTLKTFQLDVSSTIQASVDQGKILLLLDYQTKDFTTATTSGMAVKIGATSNPSACTNVADMVCRHHLDGNASFTVAADSPSDALVTGPVQGGTFTGGPGDLSIQLALGTTDPIRIALHKARVKAVSASATGITATLGGAILQSDLQNNLIPAVLATLQGLLAACPLPHDPANKCSCTGNTATIIGIFDTNKDCQLTLDEVANNSLTKTFLMPDVCASGATCAQPDGLSVGIKVDAVKATIL